MTGEFEAEILSQEGVASVEVRKLEGGIDDYYVRFYGDPQGNLDVILWRNRVGKLSRLLFREVRLDSDDDDVLGVLRAIGSGKAWTRGGNSLEIGLPDSSVRRFV